MRQKVNRPEQGNGTASPSTKTDRRECSEQAGILLDILIPQLQRRGNSLIAMIPGHERPYSLRPKRGIHDMARSWVFMRYMQKYGAPPKLQAYKAAIEQAYIRLFAADAPATKEAGVPASFVAGAFSQKVHVDGQDNLYIFDDCIIGRLKTGEEGEELIGARLWGQDMLPRVHKVYVVHDTYEGQQTQYDLEIAGTRQIIPIETLQNGKWVDYFPNATGLLNSRAEGLYKAVIMQVAKNAPKINAFETSGWKEISVDGQIIPLFLLPDGRFVAPAQLDASKADIRLIQDILSPEEKALWDTFAIPTGPASEQEQAAAYRYLKGLAPRAIGLRMLAHGIESLLYGLRNAKFGPSYSLTLEAERGSGKTSIALIPRSCYAPYKYKPIPDSTFSSTMASVESDLTYRESVPVFVDDLAWEDATQAKKQEYTNVLESIIRAAFNEAPVRKRMTGKMKRQRRNYIRNLPLFTVEQIPPIAASALRRTLIIPLKRDEIRKQTDSTGLPSLEQMDEYANVLAAWGYSVIRAMQGAILKNGKEQVLAWMERIFKGARARIRQAVMQRWEGEQANTPLPGDWDSLADMAAYELVGLHVLRRVAPEAGISEQDVFPYYIDDIFMQILRMEKRLPDEEGLHLFERALMEFLDSIAIGKMINGERWRIDAKVPASGEERAPTITTKDGYQFPPAQWGWGVDDDAYPRQTIVAYVDDFNAVVGHEATPYLYLTTPARAELLKIVDRLAEDGGIQSEKALGALAEKEGWMSRDARDSDGKHRTRVITPPQGARRVWCIDLKKWLAHYEGYEGYEGMEQEQEEPPDNVTPLPVSTREQVVDVGVGKGVSGNVTPLPIPTREQVVGKSVGVTDFNAFLEIAEYL